MCWSILLSPLLLITFKELTIFKNRHCGCFTSCVRLISLYVLMKCQSLQNWNGAWNFELISTRKIIWNYEKLDVQIQHKFNIFLNYISNVILDIGNWRDNWSPRNPFCWICFFFYRIRVRSWPCLVHTQITWKLLVWLIKILLFKS